MKVTDFFKILGYDEVVMFGKAQRNRKVKDKHVNEFVNLIKNKEYDEETLVFGLIPIIINPVTNHILDGQHRLEAFKKAIKRGLIPENAKILVGFWKISDECAERDTIIVLNTNSKNWTLEDYLNSYAQMNEYYAKLRQFCQTHSLCNQKNGDVIKLNYRYGAAIIKGKACHSALKNEEFACDEAELALAEVIHEEMVQIRQKLEMNYSSTDIEGMATEWHKARKIMSYKDILKVNIPQRIMNNKPKNATEWENVFGLLYKRIAENKMCVAA